MNYIVISPYYPTNFQNFSKSLNAKGVNVLGIGQEPYDQLGQDLQNALTEYYRVDDLEDIDEVKRAVAFLFFKHGKIDRIESHNEHWLEMDAELRDQFNVFGNRSQELRFVKFKSEMKKKFKDAGVPVAKGEVALDEVTLKKAIKKIKLPVVAKPDNGVGSSATYKLKTDADIEEFLKEWNQKNPYFIEEYIEDGILVTYDGLIDQNGEIVFETSFEYNIPTLELIRDQLDLCYIIQKEVEPRLKEYGQKIVKEIGFKERFFHIEFFRLKNGGYIALEYNNRPAGGYTIDMYNYAYSIDLFDEYANIILGREFQGSDIPNQYTAGITQRDKNNYVHSVEEIKEKYAKNLKLTERVPKAFSKLQGDRIFIMNADTLEEIDEIGKYIKEKVKKDGE